MKHVSQLTGCLIVEKSCRHVNDLLTQIEAEKSSRAAETEEAQMMQMGPPTLADNQMPNIAPTDQIELKTMVDAIAAASHREAEAHETAIFLTKENDELKLKLRVLIEDNNKLIELYEGAVAENHNDGKGTKISEEQITEGESYQYQQFSEDLQMKKELDNLKHQLLEMHEENEKLMGLYEKAMQEKNELKRLFAYNEQKHNETRAEINCPENLVEIDGGRNLQSNEFFMPVD